jgi:hypothetical protein
MGIKKRGQIRRKQRDKRHKKRLKLKSKGIDPDKVYVGRYFINKP